LGKDRKAVALPVFAGDNGILLQKTNFCFEIRGFLQSVGQEILPERFEL